jgi:high-affinity K+ transport system ATPase subunit B
MWAQIAFDTLQFTDELKRSGIDQGHAEAITKATAKALSQVIEARNIATKSDISALKDLIYSNTWKIISSLSIIQCLFMAVFSFMKHVFT